MKYSDNFVRDVRFYFRNRHRFVFFGGVVRQPPYSRKGVSGIEAFRLFDSNGRLVPTKHPRLFVALMRTKKSINWHIKEWADGFEDMFESVLYYVYQFVDPPPWIRCSLEGAIERVYKQKESLAGRLGVKLGDRITISQTSGGYREFIAGFRRSNSSKHLTSKEGETRWLE